MVIRRGFRRAGTGTGAARQEQGRLLRIAVIGAGKVGTALGRGWTRCRHQVTYGVRDPRAPRAEELAREGVQVATPPEAVERSEVVVLATPWSAAEAAVRSLGNLGGRPLLDATNPIGPGLTFDVEEGGSGGELVRSWAPTARVVKVFNTAGVETLASPLYADQAATMFYCGDDESACAVAARLATDLGFDAVSAGPLRNARLLESLALLWISLATTQGAGRGIAFRLLRRYE